MINAQVAAQSKISNTKGLAKKFCPVDLMKPDLYGVLLTIDHLYKTIPTPLQGQSLTQVKLCRRDAQDIHRQILKAPSPPQR
jgi:hypothetical protein